MKKIAKKLAAVVLAASMAFSMVACGGETGTAKYKAGTYSATVTGMHEMTVTVTVSDTEITDIQIEHEETPGIGTPVIEEFPAKIMEIQGLGLDAVAGATLTSNAVLEGVAACMEQAGADVELSKLSDLQLLKKQKT